MYDHQPERESLMTFSLSSIFVFVLCRQPRASRDLVTRHLHVRGQMFVPSSRDSDVLGGDD